MKFLFLENDFDLLIKKIIFPRKKKTLCFEAIAQRKGYDGIETLLKVKIFELGFV